MANILLNFISAKTGGGKNILDNFILRLIQNDTTHNWYVVTPDFEYYKKIQNPNIKIVDPSFLSKYNFLFLWLYYFEFANICRKYKIDLIMNFGDVIIPCKIKQVYFFDWAYAVYNENYIWNNMSFKDYVIRKIKVLLIRREINNVAQVIAQTRNMATRLHQYYGISKVLIIPTPVGFDFAGDEKVSKNHFPLDTKKFLVPSSFSSHKNLEILIQVAEIIEEQKLPFSIILTIDHNKKTDQYFKKIAVKGLRSIISIGSQKNEEMPAIYKQCNAMLLPTLLESFGLPYVEAMAYGLPIVTSKLDFARDVCNDAAYYFNPFDSRSIVSAMEQVFSNKEQTENNILSGKRKIKELPCWDNVFKEFVKVLEVELIN